MYDLTMNNQGLEALAALASAAPSSATNRGSGDSGERGGGGSREALGASASVGSENGSLSREQPQQGSQSSHNGDQSNHSQQLAQWQQLMSSLAASGGNPNALGPNSNASLSFLSGMQQSPPTENSSLMMAMQNMAQYQLMAQAQAASQNQLSALSNLALQLSRTNPQTNGIGLSLQNPFASLLKGKLLVYLLDVCGIKLSLLIAPLVEWIMFITGRVTVTNTKVAVVFLFA